MAGPNGRATTTPFSPDDLPEPNEYGRYDPTDFVIPAQDTKGHSQRVWCRVQPGHDRQLDILLQSKKWPYRTKGDIVRHAVHRHIKWLEQMEPVESVMAQVDAMNDVLMADLYQQEFDGFFERLTKSVNNYLGRGANNEAKRIIAKVRGNIQKMPTGYWRDLYLDKMETCFLHILDDKSGTVKRPTV